MHPDPGRRWHVTIFEVFSAISLPDWHDCLKWLNFKKPGRTMDKYLDLQDICQVTRRPAARGHRERGVEAVAESARWPVRKVSFAGFGKKILPAGPDI